jgi:hypothetical protein
MEILQQGFSMLNESNRKNIIKMTKSPVLTQNAVVSGV